MQILKLADYATAGRDGNRRLDWNAAAKLIQSPQWAALLRSEAPEILFSMAGLDFANPDGLLWLILLGDLLDQRNGQTQVRFLELPRNRPEILRYLNDSDFVGVASELFFVIGPPAAGDQPRSSHRRTKRHMRFNRIGIESLVGVQRQTGNLIADSGFVNALGINPIGEQAASLTYLLQVLNETTKNVVQHSAHNPTAGWGYIVAGEFAPGWVRMCVGDTGRGLRESLALKSVHAENAAEAVRKAFTYHYFDPHGEGLFRVLQFVSLLGGRIVIRSGDAEGSADLSSTRLETDDAAREFVEGRGLRIRQCSAFPGVQMMIHVRSPRHGHDQTR